MDISTPSSCLKNDVSGVFHKFFAQPWLDQTFSNFQCQQESSQNEEGENKKKKMVEEFEKIRNHSLQVFMVHSGAVQIKRAELTEFFVFYGDMHGVNINPVRHIRRE
jgi:hypothetical protein